jgi:hypothetical protein
MSVISLIPEMVLSQPDPMTENLQLLLLQLQATIDELSCWSAGIAALISELQKVPDTLAVVGFTLAEISALVAKVSPAAIMGLKTLFPMIFALLGSPQFVVLAGVGAAATVIVLGGYKIIKNVVGGGAAKASLSGGDEDEYPEGDWDEPVEEIVREPPREQRMIEAAPTPPAQPELRRAQSEAPTQRRQLMPARVHTSPVPTGKSEVLAFDISSASSGGSSGSSSNNSSNSNSTNNSGDEEGVKRHHRKRRGSNDKSEKDKSEKSRSKSGSSSHHSKSKSDKEKGKSEKDKSSSKSDKHESSEPSSRRGSSSKSHDKHEKSDKKERKTSVDGGAATPTKEKKPFFSLTTSPFSSPAGSTTSLPTEKQKKKERKSSLSSASSAKEHKEAKKPKEFLSGIFEGRSA